MEEFLLQNLFWLLLAALSAAGLTWTFARAGKINLSPQAAILAVSRGGGVFLDIRPAAEFSGGHIPNAQNIPDSELTARGAALAKFKKKPVVLVGQRGQRINKIVQQLAGDGFSDVRVLAGGMDGWRDANLPLINRKGGKKK